ncbi:M50 family metallopeptidase [Catenuloplanes atrovinosus]|uniref:Membrane-associated protease RseP (Regulator of RpoE activity) n=1 Tax=Catenuloplanes atrovinosus TaxID=137266 RepID=A0AAE4C6B4_9ACTN|nr:site-2 protease family protein [Catenuloplanes atrovinosus]MDR7273356.1 membrane-associated protease RseP (regulator of RpoE activity) [Catenuloplanes atrovinosus]
MSWMFWVGVLVFAIGLIISLALHEAGHMWSAQAFKMKVTRFFIGFGPTLFSFRRGEIEYGVKAIPAGAFVKIVGMVPQDDDVAPEDEPRAMWRQALWKRTIVMGAGSAMHFALGTVLLWGTFAFIPFSDPARADEVRPEVAAVTQCTTPKLEVRDGRQVLCDPATGTPSAAKQAGLQPGDVITAVNGTPVTGWGQMSELIRAAGGRSTTLAFERGGVAQTATVTIPLAERVKQDSDVRTVEDITPDDIETVGVLGISPVIPKTVAGPAAAFGLTYHGVIDMVVNTFESLRRIPEKIPLLWAAIVGEERDPETPISVLGATRLGGELVERQEYAVALRLLVVLNFFIGIFNLLPLLPLDGGHIAIAWFERIRSWIYARLGRPDPGRVDYFKLMPLTYVVILIFGAFTLLTLTADIVNPITLN